MKRTPLKRVGRRASMRDKSYDFTRQVVIARDNNTCQGPARHAPPCMPTKPCSGSLDVHHILPTGRGGPKCDATNCVLLCRFHHQWVHEHTRHARTLGLYR